MTSFCIDASGLRIDSASGRPLFDELSLRLGAERVALVGRNGVGKSTLLRVLAGELEPERGRLRTNSAPRWVPQLLERVDVSSSHGEQRRRELALAFEARPSILLLDEPSEDLDDEGLAWLRREIRHFSGCLVVASHDRRLLGDFDRFLVASETGCRHFAGDLAGLEASLEREQRSAARRYASQLRQLAETERHMLEVEQRKARKKRYGRISELDRATPRIRLNQKRGEAQVSHGRLAQLRAERLDSLRLLTRAMRRSLTVELSVPLSLPSLPKPTSTVMQLEGVAVTRDERSLLERLDLCFGRERVGLVGPNGAGKTTLLELALRARHPPRGRVRIEPQKIGSIGQRAADWCRAESLLESLDEQRPEEALALLAAHRFPLPLARRPLASLSPGERVRAALIVLFQRRPAVELLVLDEPTFSLDLLGQSALRRALQGFTGGLLVASHDRAFLAEIGVRRLIELGTCVSAQRDDGSSERSNSSTSSGR